jgi:hypothetical protein
MSAGSSRKRMARPAFFFIVFLSASFDVYRNSLFRHRERQRSDPGLLRKSGLLRRSRSSQ